LKSPRNDTGIAMTNLHRSPPMNQSKTDLGIVHESQLLRFGINPVHFFGGRSNSTRTPLRIPYGNKEVALKLGARYGSAGWYAPPGVDLSAFGERGWLL
jgi:hypothetical protein